MNNCIGYANYKHFVLFLAYGFYLCVFGFFAMLPFVVVFFQLPQVPSSSQWSLAAIRRLETVDAFGKYQVLLVFFVAAVFGVSLVSHLGGGRLAACCLFVLTPSSPSTFSSACCSTTST